MTSRRPLISAVLAASAVLAPTAAAQAPAPTLAWDRGCYAENQPMTFSGAGYTPGGPVLFLFSRIGTVLGSYETTADGNGAIDGKVMAKEDDVLPSGKDRELIGASANDRTRTDQGESPQSTIALATFTFTRWWGASPGRLVPGRKSWAEAYGWAFAEGQTAYFLFRKRNRTVAAVRLGTLGGPCGDLEKRFTVPRKLSPGAYKVFLSTVAARPSDRGTWRNVRVVRKLSAAAADAGTTRMHRAG